MGFFSRIRNFIARAFEPVVRTTPKRRQPPPAPPKPPPKPRPPRKQRKRAKRRESRPGILQIGEADPRAPAVYASAIRRLMAAARRQWPNEPVFVVAVFARWEFHSPEEGLAYPSEEELEAMIGHAYGSPVRGITKGRHYWGWRAGNYAAGTLGTDPLFPVNDLLESVPGRRPIRSVSVRPRAD